MGLSLEQKQAMVSEVSTKLANAQTLIVAEYRGLDVERVTQLRSKARKSGVYLRVLKNTLARRAVQGTPFEKLSGQMVGPLMYGISEDPVAGAKVLSEFAKENELFVIKAGAMSGAVMSAQDIKALASLPSREQLIATLLGTMQAPVAKLVRTMNEVPGKFVRTLAALKEQKEKQAA
ncbi:MAG: 50S ribosomal protein L10 [Rhodospirillaceae bacterium]